MLKQLATKEKQKRF